MLKYTTTAIHSWWDTFQSMVKYAFLATRFYITQPVGYVFNINDGCCTIKAWALKAWAHLITKSSDRHYQCRYVVQCKGPTGWWEINEKDLDVRLL